MTRYFVSRHSGAIAWGRRHALAVDVWVTHLDPHQLAEGDTVIGSLPVHLVAEVCARGAAYQHLRIDLALEQRGRELDVDDLDSLGACLVGYQVTPVDKSSMVREEGTQ